MKTFLCLVALLAVCQGQSLHLGEDTLDCDHHFKLMSKIAAEHGIDYDSIWYRNRNKTEYDCILYYLKFIETLGFDISDLQAAFLPWKPRRKPAGAKHRRPHHPSDKKTGMRYRY